jgi:hypothetical protein
VIGLALGFGLLGSSLRFFDPTLQLSARATTDQNGANCAYGETCEDSENQLHELRISLAASSRFPLR